MKYFKSSLFFTVIFLLLIQKSSAVGMFSLLLVTFFVAGAYKQYEGTHDRDEHVITEQQGTHETIEYFVVVNHTHDTKVADLPVTKGEECFKESTRLKDGSSQKLNVPANGTRDIGGSVSAWPWALPTMGLFGR